MVKDYIVTGGLGFIGSNIVNTLMAQGNNVFIIDNMHTGHFKNVKEYTDFARGINHVRYFGVKPDVIFHLGIPSSTPMYDRDKSLVGKTLEDWTTILDYAAHNPEIRVVFASTSSLYSGNSTPFHEDMPVAVTSFYSECRYAMERLAKLYHQLYGVQVIGLRLFSVYGPNETFKHQYANCLTQFLLKILRGQPPVIYGDGSQTRDFTYVDDVVRAFLLASESDIPHSIFNVGTGIETTYRLMVHKLNQVVPGDPVIPKFIDMPMQNYVYYTCANTLNASRFLDFRAKIMLDEGIKRVVEIYSKDLTSNI